MKRIALCVCSAVLAFSITVFSADKVPPTKEQKAQTLIEKGLTYIKANGKEKAMTAFMDPKGGFIDGEFYIFATAFDGTCLAHINTKMVNTNQIEMVDADGKVIMKEFLDVAKTQGKGWVNYRYSNPATKKIQEKTSYVANVEGLDMLIGCGFYK
jgi:cytochrome c